MPGRLLASGHEGERRGGCGLGSRAVAGASGWLVHMLNLRGQWGRSGASRVLRLGVRREVSWGRARAELGPGHPTSHVCV